MIYFQQTSIQSPDEIVSVTEMFGIMDKNVTIQAPHLVLQSTSDFEVGLISATEGVTSDEDKRAKIFEELISSELQFITDINSYTEVSFI